jgi:alkanesulfonate monooxygenase SsuD/methylene tetrahydromethanopterin reductase-like flavin-dependent oxidoreductase (luciferase family)
MAPKRAIYLAPFDELSDPRLVAEYAAWAEEKGFDGFFVWDHIRYSAPTRTLSDPWVVLSAVAMATDQVRIGPMVTPVSRRRPQKLARETVTLDRLSRGRLTLGVGLGSDHHGEFTDFDEVSAPRDRARLLDEGLDRLAAYWDGEFEPPPVQQPRIPVWVASRWPARKPLQRAARWDGLFPIEMPGPDELAELVAEVHALRGDGPFDIVVMNPPGTDTGPWEEAGATWCLTSFGQSPREAEVRDAIEAGP